MRRREFTGATSAALGAVVLFAHQRAQALTLADITSSEASQGLKTALEKGAVAAVALLGKPDGFLANTLVRIPLPKNLQEASKLLRAVGQGPKVDQLVTSMNRAAEQAVPMAKTLLVNAVKDMTVDDAKAILRGGETSVTTFFAGKTREPLIGQFMPVVVKATEKVDLARQYNQIASRASGMGLVKKEDANIQQYVTSKALDGLYLVIGEEEKKLRQDPVASGSAILKKVFGALK